MSKLVLITGGVRSGKSKMAVDLAEKSGKPVVFLATCQPLDEEMQRRVAKHKQDRPESWQTVEEPIEIEKVIAGATEKLVVLDCLTLWITNLVMAGLDQKQIMSKLETLLAFIKSGVFEVIIVTNEIGWGIVPDNQMAREFRDIVGFAHQKIAAQADEVYMTVCGIPMLIKGTLPEGDYSLVASVHPLLEI